MAKPLSLFGCGGMLAIKTLQSLCMSNPPFTDDNEGRPQGRVCLAGWAGVDHGLPPGRFGTGETGLSRYQLENRLRRHVDQFFSAVDSCGVNFSNVCLQPQRSISERFFR